jgi:small GTP-binding protein
MLQTINRLCLIFFLLLGLLLQNVSFRLNYGTKPRSISISRYGDERFSLGYRFVIRRGKVIGLFTTLPEKIITESQHPIQNGNSKRVYIPRSDRNSQQTNTLPLLHSLQSSLPDQHESEIVTGYGAATTIPPTTTQSTSERKAYVPQSAHRKIGINRNISFQNGKRSYVQSKSMNSSSSLLQKNQLPYVKSMHSPVLSNSVSTGKQKSLFGTKNITTSLKSPVREEIVQMRLAKMRKEFERLHPIEIPIRPLSISLSSTEQNRSSTNGTDDFLIGYLRAENTQIMDSPSLVRRRQKVVKKKPSQRKTNTTSAFSFSNATAGIKPRIQKRSSPDLTTKNTLSSLSTTAAKPYNYPVYEDKRVAPKKANIFPEDDGIPSLSTLATKPYNYPVYEDKRAAPKKVNIFPQGEEITANYPEQHRSPTTLVQEKLNLSSSDQPRAKKVYQPKNRLQPNYPIISSPSTEVKGKIVLEDDKKVYVSKQELLENPAARQGTEELPRQPQIASNIRQAHYSPFRRERERQQRLQQSPNAIITPPPLPLSPPSPPLNIFFSSFLKQFTKQTIPLTKKYVISYGTSQMLLPKQRFMLDPKATPLISLSEPKLALSYFLPQVQTPKKKYLMEVSHHKRVYDEDLSDEGSSYSRRSSSSSPSGFSGVSTKKKRSRTKGSDSGIGSYSPSSSSDEDDSYEADQEDDEFDEDDEEFDGRDHRKVATPLNEEFIKNPDLEEDSLENIPIELIRLVGKNHMSIKALQSVLQQEHQILASTGSLKRYVTGQLIALRKRRQETRKYKKIVAASQEVRDKQLKDQEKGIVILPLDEKIAVHTLASLMSLSSAEVIKHLIFNEGMMVSANQMVSRDLAIKMLYAFNKKWKDEEDVMKQIRDLEKAKEESELEMEMMKEEKSAISSFQQHEQHEQQARLMQEKIQDIEDQKSRLQKKASIFLSPETQVPKEKRRIVERAPIVTIMGHVDHGKTTLLDSIRNTNVAKSEAGGITQAISAFSVATPISNRNVTFIDTPGHAAFREMRKRGTRLTDIVVLVVAADDGVMEQTIECIEAAKEGNCPIVVAINKVDKPGVDVMKVKQDLAGHGIIVEEFGGETQCAEISAKHQTGLNDLLEKILVQVENRCFQQLFFSLTFFFFIS